MNGHDVSSRSHGDLVNLINYMPESPLTFTVLSPDYIHSTDSELRRAWARHHLPVSSVNTVKGMIHTTGVERTPLSISIARHTVDPYLYLSL